MDRSSLHQTNLLELRGSLNGDSDESALDEPVEGYDDYEEAAAGPVKSSSRHSGRNRVIVYHPLWDPNRVGRKVKKAHDISEGK
jgi:hypothetical protein